MRERFAYENNTHYSACCTDDETRIATSLSMHFLNANTLFEVHVYESPPFADLLA